MNCQEALELLYDYIDKESSEIDTSKIQDHLDGCRHCFERYRLEESVQALINEKSSNLKATPKLDQLRSSILSKLDSIDSEAAKPSQGRVPFLKPSTVLVLAASLILVVAAAFLASDFYRHNDRYIPLERAHWAVPEDLTSFQDESQTALLMNSLASDASYALDRSVGSFELYGGLDTELMGITMAHFAYSDGRRIVSVFVAPANAFSIPDDLMSEGVQQAGLTFYDHNCRGCRLVFHQMGNAVVITASTDRTVDLLKFVPGRSSI